MRCSKCGAENPDRAKFCEGCASPFTRRCTSCQPENSRNAKLCIECAKPLQSAGGKSRRTSAGTSPIQVSAENPDASLEGERKTLTTLFSIATVFTPHCTSQSATRCRSAVKGRRTPSSTGLWKIKWMIALLQAVRQHRENLVAIARSTGADRQLD